MPRLPTLFWLWMLALIPLACTRPTTAAPETVSAEPAHATPDSYVGTATCQGCHQKAHETSSKTWMGRTVREPVADEMKLVENSILCGGLKADYVLGGRLTLRYLQKQEQGGYVFLPCEYDVINKLVKPFHVSDWKTFSFDQKCAACHTTAFNADDNTWREMGVGCESCHGPGSRHGDYTKAQGMVQFAKVSAVQEGMICSSCHLQGGYSLKSDKRFPENYKPGDDLFATYRFDWASLNATTQPNAKPGVPGDVVVDPIDVHQKILMRLQLDAKSDLRCTSCHAVHAADDSIHKALPRQDFCFQCHENKDGKFSLKNYQVQCPVCEF